jgi:anhydro-N-acetylmuramic acid kinase
MRVIGVMSGTSLDGIDVAIVDIDGKKIDTIAFRSVPYPKAVRNALLGDLSAAEISRLNFLLGELYAQAILETCRRGDVALESVRLIGLHGQTVYHEGGAHTLQIGEAAVVAERTGIDVISNFREADIAAGGQGAPLVPYVDYLLFRHPRKNRVALNIGGIANITAIPAGAKKEDVIAFDTGPGNMVIDALVAHWTGGKQKFDRDGRIARSGKIHESLYESLFEGYFIHSLPPKSCGREQFGADFVRYLVDTGIPLPDLIATATLLTVCSIAYQIVRTTIVADEVIASGGGIHNTFLMEGLRDVLPMLTTSADFGIDPDAKEAIAFAVLAHESARRRPANLPSATGARHPVILGKRSYSSVSRISSS